MQGIHREAVTAQFLISEPCADGSEHDPPYTVGVLATNKHTSALEDLSNQAQIKIKGSPEKQQRISALSDCKPSSAFGLKTADAQSEQSP